MIKKVGTCVTSPMWTANDGTLFSRLMGKSGQFSIPRQLRVELLRELPREQGERRDLTYSPMDKVKLYTDVLKANSLAPATAARWQLEAEIPEDTFEQFIAETIRFLT
jgi:hypothetical protein